MIGEVRPQDCSSQSQAGGDSPAGPGLPALEEPPVVLPRVFASLARPLGDRLTRLGPTGVQSWGRGSAESSPAQLGPGPQEVEPRL